jgi:MFS family permease
MSTANAVVSETSPKVRLAVVFGLLLLVAAISVGFPVAGVVTPVIVGILAFVTWRRTGSKLLIGIMAICACLALASLVLTTAFYQVRDVSVETTVVEATSD